MSKFAIATFCYGERYQKQVNRMISEIDNCDFKPTVIVVTDDVDFILDKPFVKKYDISEFNPEYRKYSDSYYSFDFSVKRYSLLAALNLGYNKIILCDADAVPNKSLFNEDNILKGFVQNSIQGQVTYNFSNEIINNSQLGERFLEYEKYFNVTFDKNNLNFMPEDCIQFIDIDSSKFYNFLRVWNDCINHKKNSNLSNTPAGNIDEMCFAALKCGISVGNNSDKVMNALIPIHDKWYDSSFNSENITEEIKNINPPFKKIVVTSIYELNYCEERGGSFYKSFSLLTQTIRNLIFDDYEYVIYTDDFTYKKHDLSSVFPQKNVTIKIVELNSDYYLNILNPIRIRRVSEGEMWDRIHSVKNYIEVIYNKIQFLVDESIKNENSQIVWIDSGMFGTSCSNGWRDYMNEICHDKLFLDKIFDKISEHNFIALKGNHILMNYEVREKINNEFGVDSKIVPACLFGGKSDLILKYFSEYKEIISRLIDVLNDYTSEQEVLFLLLNNKNIKFYDFDDWDDLQRGVLKIMDLYDENKYETHSCSNYKLDEKSFDFNDFKEKSFTEIADFFGIDKGSLHESHMYTLVYENYLSKYINSCPTFVEIGINDSRFPGGSIKFWDKIFDEMNFYGYDITECSHLNFNPNKITTFIGDQNNVNDLERFISTFELSDKIDFIIDDGSHEHEHIITSFTYLYPHLKVNGLYLIEGLHASWAKREQTITKIKNYLSALSINNFLIDDKNNKIIVIQKL
jgi:hypothetical protein